MRLLKRSPPTLRACSLKFWWDLSKLQVLKHVCDECDRYGCSLVGIEPHFRNGPLAGLFRTSGLPDQGAKKEETPLATQQPDGDDDKLAVVIAGFEEDFKKKVGNLGRVGRFDRTVIDAYAYAVKKRPKHEPSVLDVFRTRALRAGVDPGEVELVLSKTTDNNLRLEVDKQKDFEPARAVTLRLQAVGQSIVPVEVPDSQSLWARAIEGASDPSDEKRERLGAEIVSALERAHAAGRTSVAQSPLLGPIKGYAATLKAEVLHELADDPESVIVEGQGKRKLYRLRRNDSIPPPP